MQTDGGLAAGEALPPQRLRGLPSWLTSFSGRDQTLVSLDESFQRSRLVTLLGPGGAGKTRLASEFAARQAGAAFFTDLTGLHDGELLAATILSTLRAADVEAPGGGSGGEDPLLQAATSIGSALLVIDNCERVALECGLLAGRLLQANPQLRVLATSRRVLAAAGECVLPVAGLDLPSPEAETTEAMAASAAVALFVDRASLQVPGFVLNEGNATAVAQICRLVDGLPLGIELAAPLVRSLAPAVIAERLRTGRLVLQGSGLHERQRTFESLVDWSCGLLSDPARALLRRLAYFVEGFTLEAAEAVCAGEGLEEPQILPALSELVDTSLVHVQAGPRGHRYLLLETVRDHMGRKLNQPPPPGAPPDKDAPGDGANDDRDAVFDFTFTSEGDVWLLGAGERTVRLRASRGLAHLHALISAPNQDLHALELAGRGRGRAVSPDDLAQMSSVGGSGLEVADAQALAAYKSRYIELAAELSEAEANHDRGQQERVREEMGFLAEEVQRATGLGGRMRVTGSQAERARVAVTRAVRSAMARISADLPDLGRHLDQAIVTGLRCSYRPQGPVPRWRL